MLLCELPLLLSVFPTAAVEAKKGRRKEEGGRRTRKKDEGRERRKKDEGGRFKEGRRTKEEGKSNKPALVKGGTRPRLQRLK